MDDRVDRKCGATPMSTWIMDIALFVATVAWIALVVLIFGVVLTDVMRW